MEILRNLNENQREAVLHTEGPLLILAGAGSGKTRVITNRIMYLINEKQVPPYRIFAVTFTNKAAEEMKNRIIDLLGAQGNSVFIKTFHSASVYILRRFGEKIGIPSNFSIFDTTDQVSVIKEILINLKLDPKKVSPSTIASKISEIKDKTISTDDISAYIPNYFSFNFQEIYEKYHEKLASLNALDFNDLLIKTVILLRDNADVLEELQRFWTYFMIDEYQDTNRAQYLIAKYLASKTKNICVVGDDDQSIYSWRGADIRNILEFEEDYTDTKIITLEHNYRSTEPILQAASALILNNIMRKSKNIIAAKGNGEPVTCVLAANEYSEAEFAVNTIVSLKLREKIFNKDFAIFYRTNAQSRIFEEILRKENINYKVIGGLKFYDRKEIKDILCYLRFALNPKDEIALKRIINTPLRGIGSATVEKIISSAIQINKSAWEMISKDLLEGRFPKGLESFKKLMTRAIDDVKLIPEKIKLSEFVNNLINSSGYRQSLLDDDSIESSARIDNIDEFLNSVYDYENQNPDAELSDFIQAISLMTSEESPDSELDSTDFVTLMTVHNAKGLEFPVVFLTGMEEDIFPHKLSVDTEEGVEEERRLCYVGITRAKEKLFITSAELRRSFYGSEYKQPSRFLAELPQEVLELKRFFSNGFRSSTDSLSSDSFTPKSASFTTRDLENDIKNEKSIMENFLEKGNHNDSKFKLRDRVIHPKFGIGTIIKIEGSGDNVKLTIFFGSTPKVFLEKYTPLEKIE